MRILLALSLLVFWLLVPVNAEDVTCPLPDDAWESAAPDSVGLDGETLMAGEAHIEAELPFLRSVLIVRHGCLAYEAYFGGMDDETRMNGFSVTKSVTGTLVGIAIEAGEIASAADPIAMYLTLPEGDEHGQITIGHLLHMLSGLGWDENRFEHIVGMLQTQRDEVDFILSLPLAHPPGTFWSYSTADSHLLSAVVAAATDGTTLEYAQTRLFEPLGISDVEWTPDANGVNLGGTQLFWRPRDMAKFGLLYLHDGAWGEEQIVPAEWVAYLTDPQLADPSVHGLSYAAQWWYVYLDGYAPMYAAVGYGGQHILVAPALDLVVVTTANSNAGANSYVSGAQAQRQQEAIFDYLETYVLAAAQ